MQTMNMRMRWARLASLIMVASLLVLGISSVQALQVESSPLINPPPVNLPFLLKGTVKLLGQAASNLSVTLYEVQETHSRAVGKAVTDSQGEFFILRNEDSRQSPLYLIARGTENSPVALMAVVNLDKTTSSHTRHITINELTTVAAVWTTAQFLDGDLLTGNAVGLHNAIGNANNLIDATTGDVAPLVMDGVNIQTTTLSILYSLGNLLERVRVEMTVTVSFKPLRLLLARHQRTPCRPPSISPAIPGIILRCFSACCPIRTVLTSNQFCATHQRHGHSL